MYHSRIVNDAGLTMKRMAIVALSLFLFLSAGEYAAQRAQPPSLDAWLHIAPALHDAPFTPGHYTHPLRYDGGSRTLWLFGNSTLGDGYVPDEWTIAAQLARQSGWTVVVTSMGGQGALWELSQLKQSAVRLGDKVVFYDGGPDASYAFWKARDAARLNSWPCPTDSVLYDASALFYAVCGYVWTSAPQVHEDRKSVV